MSPPGGMLLRWPLKRRKYCRIYAFLTHHPYPFGFSKNEKRRLRRKCLEHYYIKKLMKVSDSIHVFRTCRMPELKNAMLKCSQCSSYALSHRCVSPLRSPAKHGTNWCCSICNQPLGICITSITTALLTVLSL